MQPGTLDQLVGLIDKMPLFAATPGYRRYDLLVNRAENRTLAVSLLDSRADLGALRASPALAEAYAQTRPMVVLGSAEQGVWEMAIQKAQP